MGLRLRILHFLGWNLGLLDYITNVQILWLLLDHWRSLLTTFLLLSFCFCGSGRLWLLVRLLGHHCSQDGLLHMVYFLVEIDSQSGLHLVKQDYALSPLFHPQVGLELCSSSLEAWCKP